MPAAKLDITFEQGATFELHVDYQQSNGDPVDLTGWSARMQVREGYESESPLLSLTDGDGITLGGTAGTIDVLVDDETTAGLPTGVPAAHCVWDLELENPSGRVTRLAGGEALVTPEVSR